MKATRQFFRVLILLHFSIAFLFSETPYQSSTDFQKYAMKLREDALLRVEPQVYIPTTSGISSSRYAWKRSIVTTTFWVGELPTPNNPTPNIKSSWDPNWKQNYGGFDDPKNRRGYLPAGFIPRQNPFYIALPYNDIVRGGQHKPEASRVIPWFRTAFVKQGQTVLKGRWIAIRRGNRVCYAQWEDCGPFRTDHWQYVFGNARPLPNLNRGAGLDVSPAVRDYLGMRDTDVTDWRFVDFKEVPRGPWSIYGDNNTFVIQQRKARGQYAELLPTWRNAFAR